MTLLHYLLGFIAFMLVVIAIALAEIAVRVRDVSKVIITSGEAAEVVWVRPIAAKLDRIADKLDSR